MFEDELQTRCAICGTGVLLGLIFVLAHLPHLFLIVPVAVLFLGIVADPEERDDSPSYRDARVVCSSCHPNCLQGY